jgi:transposase
MKHYTGAVVERALKVQEVILRAMAGRLNWLQAAEIIGISARQMRRWYERYKEFGYDGLYDRRRGKPSPRRVALETVKEVLRLYQEEYFDFNVRHFHEKLTEKHQIKLSYTWVKTALQEAGLVKKRKKRGPHRRRRDRRPLPGMLLHIDGSKHRWFRDDRYYDLITIMDDATSEVYYSQLVEEESTSTVMMALWEVIERFGLFCALYSDRASHFFFTPKAGGPVDRSQPTQVGRAMEELGIETIAAYSPQARGRSERGFRTWQGRLPQELRLRSLCTVEQANKFLRDEYIAEFNQRFRVSAVQTGTAFLSLQRIDLNQIFCLKHERLVARDNTVRLGCRILQLERTTFRASLAGCRVLVHEHLDGPISVWYGPHLVGRFSAEGEPILETTPKKRRQPVRRAALMLGKNSSPRIASAAGAVKELRPLRGRSKTRDP